MRRLGCRLPRTPVAVALSGHRLLALLVLSGCGAGADGHWVEAAPAQLPDTAATSEPGRPGTPSRQPMDATDTVVELTDATESVSEAVARVILSERFRAAGYRVRYDVAIARPDAYTFTADGYDPDHRVGFEYIAPRERDAELSPREQIVLDRDDSERILIIDAATSGIDAIDLTAAADDFLAALARTDGEGPDD